MDSLSREPQDREDIMQAVPQENLKSTRQMTQKAYVPPHGYPIDFVSMGMLIIGKIYFMIH